MKAIHLRDPQGPGLVIAIAVALVASLVLVQFVTGSLAVTAAFAGGVVVLGLVALAAGRLRRAPAAATEREPDWSVTLAAIEQPDIAVAITDRANRLVCANSAYREWFGLASAPPRLEVDDIATDTLARIARAAWREGGGGVGGGSGGGGGRSEARIAAGERVFAVEARRAGPSEDYLVWRLTPGRAAEAAGSLGAMLAGELGTILDEAGMAAALVGPEGEIQACNAALARGAGRAAEALAGEEFLSLLRTDEDGRIHFAREEAGSLPQLLVEAPLDAPGQSESSARLMLLIESDRVSGGGGGDAGGTQGAAPQLEALIERLPLGLAAVSRDGRFLYANGAFLRAAGVGAKALPPFPSDLVVRADKTAMADAVRRFARGAAAAGDLAVRLVPNPEEPVSIGFTGVRGLGETAVLLSLIDSSEENRLKRQVAQATKMQAVGQLAGGVAHDFNNVLTVIGGTCDLMLARHAPGDADYDDIQQILNNSKRAASLTRQLLAFSRQQTLKPEIVQLPDVLSEVTQLLRRVLGARITLDVHHDRDLGSVRVDPRQLERVIVNLAVNARDAIQEKGGGESAAGRLSFTTRHVSAEDVRRMDNDIMPPGAYTALFVQDTGGGIPRRVIAKIFEPFFTTKEAGKGTGLGLSTVYGIIKQSGGFIFADNVRDADTSVSGARFAIYLPVHAAAATAGSGERRAMRAPVREPEAKGEPAREWAKGGRVLLVEDEDAVRLVAERALTRAGYTVVLARDGEEGLEAFEQAKTGGSATNSDAAGVDGNGAGAGGFDIVVSDVVMPGIDGPAMARTLRERAPLLPILFMSGYAEAQLRAEIDMDDVHFLAKPFSVRGIVDKVGEVLKAHLQDS